LGILAGSHPGQRKHFYTKPFKLIFQLVKNEEWRALEDDFRTLLLGQIVAHFRKCTAFYRPKPFLPIDALRKPIRSARGAPSVML
jgi:hypothetical protein